MAVEFCIVMSNVISSESWASAILLIIFAFFCITALFFVDGGFRFRSVDVILLVISVVSSSTRIDMLDFASSEMGAVPKPQILFVSLISLLLLLFEICWFL